jgi:hypothetical protein
MINHLQTARQAVLTAASAAGQAGDLHNDNATPATIAGAARIALDAAANAADAARQADEEQSDDRRETYEAAARAAYFAKAAADVARYAYDEQPHTGPQYADAVVALAETRRAAVDAEIHANLADEAHDPNLSAAYAARAAIDANRAAYTAEIAQRSDDPTTRQDAALLARRAAHAARNAGSPHNQPDPTPVTVENHAATLDALTTEEHAARMIDDTARDLIDIAEDFKARELTKREKTAAHFAARSWFEQTYTTTEAAAATAATLASYLAPDDLATLAIETDDAAARNAAVAALTSHADPYQIRRWLDEADEHTINGWAPAEIAEHYPEISPIRAIQEEGDDTPPINFETTHAPQTPADRQIWREDAAAAILRTFLAAHDPHNDTDGQMMIDGKKFRFTLTASNRQIPIYLYAGQLNQIPTATIHAEHMTAAAELIAQLAQPK